ncbi:hypothetical protein GPUN_2415 [Glaciecola punicea ACAM 611]|uniref:Uncharacterized protein n=1 Tax=Glaciecola punicea ACAM 611 TaxID=1121923 RepID=H5TE03_9ALTE|nr:hypothetical protein GPUN_2415 [Glaciecola punicea ACAM 611]
MPKAHTRLPNSHITVAQYASDLGLNVPVYRICDPQHGFNAYIQSFIHKVEV